MERVNSLDSVKRDGNLKREDSLKRSDELKPTISPQSEINTKQDPNAQSKEPWLIDGEASDTLVVFAHGAGANMSHEFMETVAKGLAKSGVQVLRFNFLYMQANLADGKRRPPDRAPKLLGHFETQLLAAYEALKPKRIILLGKSMGGRMAAILSENAELMEQAKVEGVICLGYPFVPLKGGEPRLEPILNSTLPLMIIQGERDKFGTRQDIADWSLPTQVRCEFLIDGDHGFKPRKASGATLGANIDDAIAHCINFIG